MDGITIHLGYTTGDRQVNLSRMMSWEMAGDPTVAALWFTTTLGELIEHRRLDHPDANDPVT